MGNIGTTELILIMCVIFLFFGAKKIPELAQGLGKGIREFRKASREIQDDAETDSKKIENKTPEQKG
jgi:sec-independent protein translocase protein TatA